MVRLSLLCRGRPACDRGLPNHCRVRCVQHGGAPAASAEAAEAAAPALAQAKLQWEDAWAAAVVASVWHFQPTDRNLRLRSCLWWHAIFWPRRQSCTVLI